MSTNQKTSSGAIMLHGSVPKILFRLTLPMVLAVTVMMSFDAVDTYFVAQLGVKQLAAISFTVPVAMVFVSFAIGLSTASTTVIARAIGQNDEAQARRITTDAMVLAWIVSLVSAAIGWYFNDDLFTWLGAEGDTHAYIHDYMKVWYFGVPGVIVPMVCMSALRAKGMNKLQSYILMGSVMINLCLDPLLIFGFGWFPRLEISGAALATIISRWSTLFIAYYILIFRMHMFATLWVGWASFAQSAKRILHIGLPAIGTNLVVPLGGNVLLSIIATYGTAAVAGFGVALRIETLSLTVFYALSGVASAFFAQNIGGNAFARLEEAQRVIVRFAMVWGLFVATILFFGRGFFAGLFTESVAAVDVSRQYLMIVPISYMGYGLVMSLNAAFNGLSLPLFGLMLSTGRVIVLLLPGAWFLQQFFGLKGIFVAIAAANLCMAIAGYIGLRYCIKHLSNKAAAPQQPAS